MGQRKSPALLPRVFLSLAWVIAASFAGAADEKGEIGMLLEPSFATPQIHHEIKGAKKTALVPARLTKYGGVDTFTAEEWAAEKLDWPGVLPKALERANRINDAMEVTWFRDERGVLLYAVIESKDPFITSVIFATRFLPRFEKTLGTEVLVIVPTRNTLFVFPRAGFDSEKFGPGLIERYRASEFKVSLEVFQVDKDGCRVVGIIDS